MLTIHIHPGISKLCEFVSQLAIKFIKLFMVGSVLRFCLEFFVVSHIGERG